MAAYLIDQVAHVEPLLFSLPLGEQQLLLSFSDSVSLLRSRASKNNFFATPFTPSTEVLLLFPGGVNTESKDMASFAKADLTKFFYLLQDTFSLSFQIKDAVGCLCSGTLLFVLQCGSVEEAIQVVEKAEDLAQQSHPIVWSSPLHVRAMLCEQKAVDKILKNNDLSNGDGSASANPTSNSTHQALIHSISSDSRKEIRRHYFAYPICLICSDRLEGIVTGYTNPVICRCADKGGHCACLQDSHCTVCRLFMRSFHPPAKSLSASAKANPIRCFTCGRVEDPWVCLVCGYVGCSRYQAMHAKEHYMATGHCFSMNLLTQEVWDYDSDRFIHRLVFCLDNNTGGTSRIQFPEREEQALLPHLKEESTEKKATVEKKTISTKFDAQLSTSHTQYSIMIKNELDASRAQLDIDAILHLAYQKADRLRETSSSVLGLSSVNSGGSVYRVPYSKDTSEADTLLQHVQEATNAYDVTYRTVNTMKEVLQGLHQEITSLRQQKDQLSEKLRIVVQRSVTENLRLEGEINELRTVLAEIRANFSAAAALSSRVGDSDGIASMVAVGGEGKKNKKRGPYGRK